MADYHFAHFHFDSSRNLLIDSQLGESEGSGLRHKVATLLGYLIEHRDRVISKEELLDKLWQQGDYRENSLTQSIRELRLALGDSAKNSSFIKTYPQRGYQWVCPLLDLPAESVEASTDSSSVPASDNAPLSATTAATKTAVKSRLWLGVLLLLVIGLGVVLHYSGKANNPEPASDQVESLLVLPFINATDDPAMAWLELGLSDMLAIDIQRSNLLQVTPPAMANALILEAELQWPTLPVHIRSLLREQRLDSALLASVRLHNQQQVLDFTLIHSDGRNQQGSISYPSLPAAAQSITRQFLHLLKPGLAPQQPLADENPIAAQALAEGMQALQQQGLLTAQKYFQASLLIQDSSHWARAYLARSQYGLGLWPQAQQHFDTIPAAVLASDSNLAAFVSYWRSELAYRQGAEQTQQLADAAVQQAELAADHKQMARSYRLQATLAWDRMDWPAHAEWLHKADRLFSGADNLNVSAEQLFYLGNPSSEGLEKNPLTDLTLNQQRLKKALNFYQQLGNQPMIAATELAIAKNYSLPLQERARALDHALQLFRQLQQPYELAQALNYAGFYHMQLHDGATAEQLFSEAKQIAVQLQAKPLITLSDFYLAFASLDQGLDQSSLGRHGKNEAQLHRAIEQLHSFIDATDNVSLRGSALVFLGWANTDLGRYDLALQQLEQAKKINADLDLSTTYGYSVYSIMRIHLHQKNYQAVIDMADETLTTRLQAVFLARAYFELGNSQQAVDTLMNFRAQLPHLWQQQDSQRLQQYRASQDGKYLQLKPEPLSHLVYCESDWSL